MTAPPHSISFLESLSQQLIGSNEPLSLKYLEQAIYLRCELFGDDGGIASDSSSDASSLVESFVIRCNLLSMRFLKAENYVMALEYLKKAQWVLGGAAKRHDVTGTEAGSAVVTPNLLSHRPLLKLKLLAATWNNLACFFKRRGKLKVALQYMEKALKVEMKMRERTEWVRRRGDLMGSESGILHDIQNINVENPAATHLNICAILSQMGKHRRALLHAKDAVKCLTEEDQLQTQEGGTRRDPSMKAVAYHNLAVEYEFLGNVKRSKKHYRDAVLEARNTLGETHPTTEAIQNSFKNAFPDEPVPGTETGGTNGMHALTYQRHSLQKSPQRVAQGTSHGAPRQRLSKVSNDVPVTAPHPASQNGIPPPAPRRRASQPTSTAAASGRRKRQASTNANQQPKRRHTVADPREGRIGLPSLESRRRREEQSVTSGGLPSLLTAAAPGNAPQEQPRTSQGSKRGISKHQLPTGDVITEKDLIADLHVNYHKKGKNFTTAQALSSVRPQPRSHYNAHGRRDSRRSNTPTLTAMEFDEGEEFEKDGPQPKSVPSSGMSSHRTPPSSGASSQRTPVRKPYSTKLRPITPNSYSPATRRRRQLDMDTVQKSVRDAPSKNSNNAARPADKTRKRTAQPSMPVDDAATHIQRMYRGYISRKRLRQQRAIEKSYELVGGTPRSLNSPKGDHSRPPVAPGSARKNMFLPLSQIDKNEEDDFSDDEGGHNTPPAVFNHLMNISATLDNLKQSLSVENSFVVDEQPDLADDDFGSFNEEFSLGDNALNDFDKAISVKNSKESDLDGLEDFELSSIDDAVVMDRVMSPPLV